MDNELGEYLKEARENAGLRQTEVSLIFGYKTSQFVSNWERGQSLPPIDVLKKLARLYKISEAELFLQFEKASVANYQKLLRTKLKALRKVGGGKS